MSKIDAIVAKAIAQKEFPGCVVCIGNRNKILQLKAYGRQGYGRWAPRMTAQTVFDVASLTKPLATATSIMLLVEQGKLRVEDTVASHISGFGTLGKESITIGDLLLHKSGLTADNPISEYKQGKAVALQSLCKLPCKPAAKKSFIYLDIHYVLLGEIIEKVMGKPLNLVADKLIFKPLQMHNTCFLPGTWQRLSAAQTGMREGHPLKGEVHDSRAHLLGGVAGHAGLFSTASDIARYAQMMLQDGVYYENSKGRVTRKSLLKPSTVACMTKPVSASNGARALGWDNNSEHSTNRAAGLSNKAFGHGGFTGVSLWIDPELDLFYIVLSNRNLDRHKERVYKIIARIGECAVEAGREVGRQKSNIDK